VKRRWSASLWRSRPEDTRTPAQVTTLDTSVSIQDRVLSGAKWAAFANAGTQILQFGVGLVLARVLMPADFGLIASVYVISGFAVLLFEFGLGAALIQLEEPSQRDLSTVFWVNALSGIAFAVTLSACSPFIAAFYGQPELVTLTPLVALSFTLSVGVVHSAILARQLRMRLSAALELAATALGCLTSVVAALAGAGPYSLAYGSLVASGATSLLFITFVKWVPTSFISLTSLRRLWRFSAGMLGFNVVNYWGRNADNLLVGKLLGPRELGLYNRAYNLMLLPIYQINGALGRVIFPTFAAIQNDRARIRRAYLRVIESVNALTMPILFGLMATAPGLVPLLWGENWVDVVVPLQLLCIAGLPQCLLNSVGWIFQSLGRTGTQLAVSVTATTFGIVAIAFGLHWGLTGVACAVVARYWLELPLSLGMAVRAIDLSIRRVITAISPLFLLSLTMGLLVWAMPLLPALTRTSPVVVLMQVGVGVTLYVFGLRLVQPALWRAAKSTLTRRDRVTPKEVP
jgi:O-antigen/teichoic acid export membrane protein